MRPRSACAAAATASAATAAGRMSLSGFGQILLPCAVSCVRLSTRRISPTAARRRCSRPAARSGMRFLLTFALAGALAASAAAQNLSVPKKHAALYQALDARLDTFQARLPNPLPEPTLLRAAQL